MLPLAALLFAAPATYPVAAQSRTGDTPRTEPLQLNPSKCAVVLCDVWDDHWCRSAAKRCDALAKKMAPVVEAARAQGMTVVHAPSDCMAFYAEHPARKRTLALPKVKAPAPKVLPDPPLPIDDSDGGCDDLPPAKVYKAWKCQHTAIRIDTESDYVLDRGDELWNVLQARGLERVIIAGVHTNMCVLKRTFAIKALRRWDVPCLLVRDLTDAMYNPAMRPNTSHDAGTKLVIEFIEQHWCPTIESGAILSAGQAMPTK